ncbi:helix-turn-helix transcriptional regulator [Pseudovibrio sp. Tun.PSC04-5.I4]|uniref:helix-turn-helix domain-containing protein n=1 Tax=Pseudovibrio sp. Tun.PSC04-5.I4 TaxID=1798213 RepID=UPI00088E4FBA|nr:helix-turn-helix transcriptional regulator [Pseudovibrio sp. Tun.PSC04-5.I4]SDR02212.1 hypothetical protein SAMN04515695_2357 [Pseudovibrio sp. Tun.PSC04-5.I4]
MKPNERLRQARFSAGFKTATAAAKSLGVNNSTYASHENGSRAFNHDDAAHYARRFKTTPQFLLYGEDADIADRDSQTETTAHSLLGEMTNKSNRPEVDKLDLELFLKSIEEGIRLEEQILDGKGSIRDLSIIVENIYNAAKNKKNNR